MVDVALFFWSEYYVISSLLASAQALSSAGPFYLVTSTHPSKPLYGHNFQEAYPSLSPLLSPELNHYD